MKAKKPKFQRNKRVFADICTSQFLILPAIGFTNDGGSGFRIAFGWLFFLLSIRICRAIGKEDEFTVEFFDDFTVEFFDDDEDESFEI